MKDCQASLNQLFLEDTNERKFICEMPPEEKVLLQLTLGLDYIHSQRLVHGNIKPENVLIYDAGPKEDILLKWTDYGLCMPINKRHNFNWMAPEVIQLLDDPIRLSSFRWKIENDIFPAGCLFVYYLSGGHHPFGNFGALSDIPHNIRDSKPVNAESIN